MKTAGELAKKYLQWALEQKAKQDEKKPEQPSAELLAKMGIKR